MSHEKWDGFPQILFQTSRLILLKRNYFGPLKKGFETKIDHTCLF